MSRTEAVVRRSSAALKVVASTARRTAADTGCSAFGATSEHPEITGDDFEAGTLLTFFVLPFARLNAAFNENEGALFQILLGDFGLLAPDNNLVPLGALLPLTVAAFPAERRKDWPQPPRKRAGKLFRW